MNQSYIAYYRVSTKEQGSSKLGLEAQKRDVQSYTNNCANCILAEFTDVESGAKNNRPQLLKAIAEAKRTNSKLLIANLSRLSRNASFIFTLRDSNIDFVCCDLPQANSLTIGIMAVMVQDERERISKRTRKALESLKQRGVKLGISENFKRDEVRAKAIQTIKNNAANNENTLKAKKYLNKMYKLYSMDSVKLTLQKAANELNEVGIKTPRNVQWTKQNIRRLYKEVFSTQNTLAV